MNLRQIEVFHAIMEVGTITGAAKTLNISQPAVTTMLKHTEDQLRFRLFDRLHGRLVFVPPGIGKGTAIHAKAQPVDLTRDAAAPVHQRTEHIEEQGADAAHVKTLMNWMLSCPAGWFLNRPHSSKPWAR